MSQNVTQIRLDFGSGGESSHSHRINENSIVSVDVWRVSGAQSERYKQSSGMWDSRAQTTDMSVHHDAYLNYFYFF